MCLIDFIVFFVIFCFGIAIWFLIWSPYSFDKLQQGEFVNERTIFKDGNIPFLLKQETQLNQKLMFKDLIQCFNENKFDYWITESTLLGTIQYSKLMPWEDKISINILHKDLYKLVSLRPTLERNGKSKLISTKNGYLYCENNIYRYPCIDIFIIDEVVGEMKLCTPLNELGQCQYDDSLTRSSYPKDWIFPLQKTICEEIEVLIPNQSDKCLNLYFGKDYQNQIKGSKYAPIWNKMTLNCFSRINLL